MPQLPDLTDPRFLDEVGWFLYHEKYQRDKFGGSYEAERVAYSRLLLEEVIRYLGKDTGWMENRTVVSIGCGCTGDLTAFPASVKIAIDPLLSVYQQLGMLVGDEVGGKTMYLSIGAEHLPLLNECADLVLCRNALDHMPNPEIALNEMSRILNKTGAIFVSVDLGGVPTPDEPTVFSIESLRQLMAQHFELITSLDRYPAHSVGRVCSVRFAARKKPRINDSLNKEKILRAYEAQIAEKEGDKQPE